MRIGTSVLLSLVLVAALAPASPAVAGSLDAGEAVQAHGAFSYRTDLSSEIKSFEVLDANGNLLATLALSFDPEGTLMDFRQADGAHLSVLFGGGSLAVTDRRTGEIEVLTAKWGEINRGEGVELIDRHRADLDFLHAVHADLTLQVFEGEARSPRDPAGALGVEAPALSADLGSLGGGEGLTNLPQEIMELPGNCTGVTVQGYGLSTVSQSHAVLLAEQHANSQCTNQWCWGCCEVISAPCRQIGPWFECICYARSCAAPCV